MLQRRKIGDRLRLEALAAMEPAPRLSSPTHCGRLPQDGLGEIAIAIDALQQKAARGGAAPAAAHAEHGLEHRDELVAIDQGGAAERCVVQPVRTSLPNRRRLG